MIKNVLFAIGLCVVWTMPLNGQEKLPVEKIKAAIKQYKNDIRGPYHRIKWFCDDGSIRDPKDPCPDDIGGVQHATYKDEVKAFGDDYHIYFGDILASLEVNELWDEQNNHSRLKQYQLNKYLSSVDDGWILRKGQYYRGAIQSEDEEAWGIDFYNDILGDDKVLIENYYLIRQSLRDIPHAGDDNIAQKLRSESKVIAEKYPKFMDIRVKIHGQPDKSDIQLVDQFFANNRSSLSADLIKDFQDLQKTLKEFYSPVDFQLLRDKASVINSKAEAVERLNQFLGTNSQNDAPDRLVGEISDVLYTIRNGITDIASAKDRLAILDLSIKLEDIMIKQANEWSTTDLKSHLEKINALGCATVGTGMLELWEWSSIESKLNMAIGEEQMTLGELTQVLDASRSVVEWSTSLVKANYESIVNSYTLFEPMAYGFIDDRVRSSVALPLGDAVGELGAFISEESAISNRVLDLNQQSAIRGLNPGYARGELVVVSGNPDDIEVNSEKIYVFERPPSGLKPVAGIMTVSEGNLVSHVQLLARNLGIPNAALSDNNLNDLKKYNGQSIFYAVSDKGNVIMKLASNMSAEEQGLFSEEKKTKNMITVPADKIRLDQKSILNMRSVNAEDSGKLCGPKAANLGQLKSMFPEYVVEGFVIPFGIFRYHMDKDMPNQNQSYWSFLNETFNEAKSMTSQGLSKEEIEGFQLKRLAQLREAINAMELDPKFISELKENFKTIFNAEIGEIPVFLRSDTNMEDLKEFTGAGLNLTLFNINEEEKILDGIKKVWASPYTERSFKWRQQYLLNPENVFPSILVIPGVDVDYSGVMITTGINSGNKDDLTVAFSHGAGGAVDGQSAETHLITSDNDIILSPAREAQYLRLPKDGGTTERFINFNEPILNYKNIESLRAIAKEIRETMPEKSGSDYKGAYDVELGFKDNKLWLFQIRPFVENSNAKSSEYLSSIAPNIDYSKQISLSTNI